MYPPKLSNIVGLVLRDPGSKLAAELKAARAAGKPLYVVGTKRFHGPKNEKVGRKSG